MTNPSNQTNVETWVTKQVAYESRKRSNFDIHPKIVFKIRKILEKETQGHFLSPISEPKGENACFFTKDPSFSPKSLSGDIFTFKSIYEEKIEEKREPLKPINIDNYYK